MNLCSRFPNSIFLKRRQEAPIQIEGANERLTELYEALEGLEETDFATKLDDDPRAMLWEMMVAKLLRNSGFALMPRMPKGPDFTALVNGQLIVVEAICPGLGDPEKADSVPELKPTIQRMRPVPTEKILLRIAGALATKREKFDRYQRDDIVPSKAACVVAISSQKICQAWALQPCPCLTATLGHGQPYVVFDSRTGQTTREGFELRKYLTKSNGNSVSTLPFFDDAYNSISGILYSNTSALGLPYDLVGDAHFIHNPKAAVPITPGTIVVGHEYYTTLTEDGGWITEELSHSGLWDRDNF